MLIFFEDGLLAHNDLLGHYYDYIVDAKYGYTQNVEKLDKILEEFPEAVIYTNSLVALNNKYCWNDDLETPDLYIREGWGLDFMRVDELTERQIKQAHNLMKMYMNGEFDNF